MDSLEQVSSSAQRKLAPAYGKGLMVAVQLGRPHGDISKEVTTKVSDYFLFF